MDNATEFYHIRNALLEAALADYQDAAALPPEAPAFSPRYRRWEKTFLRDPFASLHRGRLGRKRALRLALCAAILLAVSVGTVWMAGPPSSPAPGVLRLTRRMTPTSSTATPRQKRWHCGPRGFCQKGMNRRSSRTLEIW